MSIDKNEKISENFWMYEFLVSNSHKKIASKMQPEEWVIENIRILVRTILQPFRIELGESLDINSGIRTTELNTAINGSKTSDHMFGAAADTTCEKCLKEGPESIARIAWEMKLPVRQIIFYPKQNFVHLSFNCSQKKEMKCELLRGIGKKYTVIDRREIDV